MAQGFLQDGAKRVAILDTDFHHGNGTRDIFYPISFFKLASDDFTRDGTQLRLLSLPTLFVMEGGYAVEEIGTNTVNVLNGFSGHG